MSSQARAGKGLPRGWRRAVLALGLGLLLWLLAWLSLPMYLRPLLEQQAGDLLGRRVSIGRVQLSPGLMTFTIQDLRVADTQGGGSQLAVQHIRLSAAMASFWHWLPVLDALDVQGLDLKLARQEAGRYDVDDVIQRLLASGEPSAALPQMVLRDLTVSDAAIDLLDVPLGLRHQVRKLRLAVPLISTRPAQRSLVVEPRLAFELNGSAFEVAAQSTPWAASRHTEARLQVQGLDLHQYAAYWPRGLPLQPDAGRLDLRLRLLFEQQPQTRLALSGEVGLRQLRLSDLRGQPVLDVDALQLLLADFQPLERSAHLESLAVQAPTLTLVREAHASLALPTLPRPDELPNAPENIANKRDAARDKAENSPPPPAPDPPWRLTLDQLNVSAGRLQLRDAAAGPQPLTLELSDLRWVASALTWPPRAVARFEGSAVLFQPAAQPAAPTQSGTPQTAVTQTAVTQAAATQSLATQPAATQPALGLPVPGLPTPGRGSGAVSARLAWQGQAGPQALTLDLQLADVRLSLDHPYLAAWRPSAWSGELSARQIDLRQLRLEPAAAAAPGRLRLEQARLRGGALRWEDGAPSPLVRLELSDIEATLGPWALDADRPADFSFSSQVRSGASDLGSLTLGGTLALRPALALQAQVQARSLPAQAFAPYISQLLNLELLRAGVGGRGQVRYAASSRGPRVQFSGDLLLEDLRANSPAGADGNAPLAGQELLSFRSLNLLGLQLESLPEQPLRLAVAETALNEFLARVTVDQSGRMNWQQLLKPSATIPAAAPTADADAGQSQSQSQSQSHSLSPGRAALPVAGQAAQIQMGPISLINGRVLFSDRFIRPGYTANLTALNGRLGAFSSVSPAGGQPALAELALSGRAEGSARLQISGQINPLAQPLALDIQGEVRELELAPLSPYSIKFAGHGIQRGKLSMDVRYRLQPDGQLASNQITLNQLVFGDPVEDAPANLPVRLAVALLADRDGVININLPVSGSLNDPEFQLGPVLGKLVLGLLTKAVTAPFSLLGALFGGSTEDAGQISFPPGSAQLPAAARARLDQLAAAMTQRPALQLTVTGQADAQAERAAYRREQLQLQLLALKQEQALAGGAAATQTSALAAASPPAETAQRGDLSAAERADLLQALYRRAQIPKPRNWAGLPLALPTEEVEALLLASLAASEDELRALALARSVAVRDALVSRHVPAQRLFIGEARLQPQDAARPPGVQLQLATP